MLRRMIVEQEVFDQIFSGRKKLIVRVKHMSTQAIRVRERMELATLTELGRIKITAIRHYATFAGMLEVESVELIFPGHHDEEVAHWTLQALYPRHQEELGVVALEIHPFKRTRKSLKSG